MPTVIILLILILLVLLVLVGFPFIGVAVGLLVVPFGAIILLVQEYWIWVVGIIALVIMAIIYGIIHGDDEQIKHLNLQIRARENKRQALENKRNVATSVLKLTYIESELADIDRDIKELREERERLELKLDQKRRKAEASGKDE